MHMSLMLCPLTAPALQVVIDMTMPARCWPDLWVTCGRVLWILYPMMMLLHLLEHGRRWLRYQMMTNLLRQCRELFLQQREKLPSPGRQSRRCRHFWQGLLNVHADAAGRIACRSSRALGLVKLLHFVCSCKPLTKGMQMPRRLRCKLCWSVFFAVMPCRGNVFGS